MSPSQKCKNIKREKKCNDSISEVNFGQEFEILNLFVLKICQDYQGFGRIGWTSSTRWCYLPFSRCKVSIGFTAASKQAPFLMHMKYKVTLPGPNYAIATQHKLILSVISDIRVREKVNGGAVTYFAGTYSSPGYCTIQSEKYRGSSAYYHL